MRLVIGGHAQGKYTYLLTLTKAGEIAHGGSAEFWEIERAAAVDELHLLAKRWLKAGRMPEQEALALADKRPEMIFVCDEVGCGIVPLEREERDWREAVGRMCCALAAQAEIVERVVCGIPISLKGSGNE